MSVQVLLVEDNPADAEMVKELLSETGVEHELTWLSNGQKAIDYFASGRGADVVLMDLNTPRASGHDVIDFIREKGIEITVVVMTGSASPIDLERATEKGAHYVVKPMTLDEMDKTADTLKELLLEANGQSRIKVHRP